MIKYLSFLIELQKSDSAMSSINSKKRELPEKISKLDEAFADFKMGFEKDKKSLEDLQKLLREKEEKLKRGNENLRKTKERLYEVKTNKEYQAMLKEIELVEGKNSQGEDEIISALEEIDRIKSSLQSKEKEVNTYRNKYEQEKRSLEKELNSLDSDLLSCQQKNDELRRKIDESLLKRYEMIKKINNGLAVVSAWKEICHGCHMNIPPQLYNELQSATGLLSCPNCNRIIYWENPDKNE